MTGSGAPRWQRYHNSALNVGLADHAFGNGGTWRHNWQYELILDRNREGAPDFQFVYPSGVKVGLNLAADGTFAAMYGGPERAQILPSGMVDLTTANGSHLSFVPVQSGNWRIWYAPATLTLPSGRAYAFERASDGRLTRITDPEGRWLRFVYQDVAARADLWQVAATLTNAPAPGQWLEINLPAGQRLESKFMRLRVPRAAQLAEIQFFAEDVAGALPAGRNPATVAAFDGDAATTVGAGFVSPSLGRPTVRPAGVRLLAAAGSEAMFVGATFELRVVQPVTATHAVIARVETSDGRAVDYDYTVSPQAEEEQVVLTSARYGDGTTARYAYSAPADNCGPKALLVSADDPRYGGPAKRIRYDYYNPVTDKLPPGTIKAEINPATGHAWARLEIDPANPLKHTVSYSDDRFHVYELLPGRAKTVAARTDSLGRTTRYEHANGGGLPSAVTDHAGRRVETQRDDHGRALAKRDGKGRTLTHQRDAQGRRIQTTDSRGRVTRIERDSAGRILKVTKPTGQVHAFTRDGAGRVIAYQGTKGRVTATYDAQGRRSSFTDALGNTHYATRDDHGRVVAETDSLGRVTRHEYNERGLKTKTTTPDGRSRSITYDDYGRKIAETDPAGRTATFAYDSLSRVTRHADFTGRVTLYEYAEFPGGCGSCTLSARPTGIVGPDGAVTSLLYDTEGRLLARTVASGTAEAATTLYAYDNDNNLVSVTDPEGRVTRYTYDDEHHRLTATDPLGRVTRWAYDDYGNVTSITAPDGAETRHKYDELNRRIATTDAAGNTTRFSYDLAGRMTTLTDARGSAYRWEYDAAGRKTAMIYPDDSRETWTYDALGRVRTTSTRAGQVKTLAYDAQGRLTAETWADHAAPDVSYAYTAVGQLASLDNGLARLSYTYDTAGRMIAETTTVAGQALLTTAYGFDAATGRRTSVTYPSGAIVAQTYTPRGEVAAVSLDGTALANLNYDLSGRRIALTRVNGVKTAWNTDAAGQLLSVLHTLGTATLASTTYELDTAGRRVAKTDESGWTERYGYDATGQLVSADYAESSAANQPIRRVDYDYDALGNRERMAEVDRAQRGPAKNTITHYTANALNQYTRIAVDGAVDAPTHDANGNLVRAQGVEYRYNAKNQLIEVTTATERLTQVHDPKGRVVERRYFTKGSQGQWIEDVTHSLRLVYDSAWNVIEDRNLGGELRARYVHGPRVDEILLRERSDGAKLCPLADGLGSTVALTDASGSVTLRFRYDAYGAPHVLTASYLPTPNSDQPRTWRFLFTGREWFGIAGLQDNRRRIYSVDLGRWLQPDPIGLYGGRNLFAYVLGDPANRRDPSGLACTCGEAVAQVAAVGPWDALTARALADSALSTAQSAAPGFPDGVAGLHNGTADAFRHCLWSCLMAQELGTSTAETVGNLHEECNPGPTGETNMDLHNNATGRTIAQGGGSCVGGCTAAIDDGSLQLAPY